MYKSGLLDSKLQNSAPASFHDLTTTQSEREKLWVVAMELSDIVVAGIHTQHYSVHPLHNGTVSKREYLIYN